ncbi:MAG: hypothetical protein QM786_04470 [Breznakibacter sp.]
MRAIKPYIAIAFLTLFAFPIAYQSLHMALAHQHDDVPNCHHHCSCDDDQGNGIERSHEQCNVCAYEFAVFTTPQTITHLQSVIHHTTLLVTLYDVVELSYAGHAKSLRAPPLA